MTGAKSSIDQPDLFGGSSAVSYYPDGLSYAEEIVTVADEVDLLARLSELALAPFRFRQWSGKRQTRSYGWRYDFEDGTFTEAEPIPDWMTLLRERAAAFGGTPPASLVQALVTRYDPGAGIGWHRDRSVFGEVLGISLGAAATLRMRRRLDRGFTRFALPLERCSIYRLGGAARSVWEHSIAPMEQQRWSITFRSLRRNDQPSRGGAAR